MPDHSGHPRRTLRQRLLFGGNMVLAFALVVSGTAMLYANWKLSNRQVVTIDAAPAEGDGDLNLPEGDLSARNYLITGSDNDACIDPDSPFAGGFGKRTSYGERSDSIMVIRVNPKDNQAAILSFPRDMWVTQAGSSRKGRINSNFDKKNPNRLVRTITQNFGIKIDHYVNVDFCTFKEVVDAVGGVRVPFTYKARDSRTGFQVLRARVCYTFQGDHALAYVRSRHYRWFDPKTNKWTSDGTADWGRISRQQDFTKRMIKKALDKSRTNPRVATNILNAALRNVITDDKVTPLLLLQLGQAMRNFDADTMGSYTFPGTGQLVGKDAVIVPDFEGEVAKKILAVFQGKAKLGGKVSGASAAPADDAVIVTTTLAAVASASAGAALPSATTLPAAPPTTAKPAPTTTLPQVAIENNRRGVIPPDDPNCQY
ncbi:MAG: LCP family protein [Ilumatobacteraceae bacterium]